MVLSPHAVPVVSSMWIRVGVTLNHTRFRFLEDGPRPSGPLFHWTCRKCSCSTLSQPENTRSSNYGDGSGGGGGGGGDEGTSSNICFGRQSPPFLAIGSLTLALALSDSVTLALFNTPLFLSRTLVYVTELCSARVTQSTFLRGVCTLVTRRRCPAWVSASPLQVDPHAFFFNL